MRKPIGEQAFQFSLEYGIMNRGSQYFHINTSPDGVLVPEERNFFSGAFIPSFGWVGKHWSANVSFIWINDHMYKNRHQLLVPTLGIQYHLKSWQRAN
ncbi:MAG: hypothetical protein AAF399_22720 [Bacteroidota bacterium]